MYYSNANSFLVYIAIFSPLSVELYSTTNKFVFSIPALAVATEIDLPPI